MAKLSGSPADALGQELDLYNTVLRDESKDISRSLRALGLNVTAATIQRKVDNYVLRAFTGLVEGFQECAQRAVPTDIEHINRNKMPFELQAEHIHAELPSAGHLEGRVYVDTEPHLGARRKKPIEAAGLAYWLNLVAQGRSMRSLNPNVGNTSQDWITDAQLEFQQNKHRYLREAHI